MNTGAITPGEVILHYQIEERLGAGGMGMVFRALDLRLKRHVALKFLPPSLVMQETYRERQLREAVAASAIEHPNIGAVHAVEETPDGGLFIVMSCYEGGTLRQRLDHGPIPQAEAIDIVMQTARGLAEAHRNGVIHRDIKPSNLMLTPQGTVKIVDFGLAKVLGAADLTATGTTMGTAAYMSPEQAVGGAVDHRTDIWSLGVVFYEMVSGRPPFAGDNPSSLLYAVVHTEPLPLEGAPAPLKKIVTQALAKAPAQRFANAEQFIRALETLRNATPGGDTVTKTMTAVPVRALKRPGRMRFVVPLLGSLLVAAAWLWLLPHKPAEPPRQSQLVQPEQPISPPAAAPIVPPIVAPQTAREPPRPTDQATASPPAEKTQPPTRPRKKESPLAYAGPSTGRIVWTGELDTGQELDLTSKDATGSVVGALPGVPVSVTVIPSSLQVVSAPSEANRWRRLVLRNDGKKVAFLVINWTVNSP